jgi:protein dithiol:quinone oxidoreductase
MLGILGLIAALLAAALYYEHIDGQEPCPLCLTQRIAYLLAGLIAFIALIENPGRLIYTILVALSSIAGASVALRQIYLQSLPPDRAPACGPGLDYMIEVFPASEVLRAMTLGTGDCASVDWSLLGLSMAGWSLLGFIAVIGLAVSPYLIRR